MAQEEAETEDITVQYTDVHGESRTHTFTSVTEVIHCGSGNEHEPWYVLIGQRPGDAENDVLDKVIRVQNEYVFNEGPLPRSPTNPEKTVAEVHAEEMGFL